MTDLPLIPTFNNGQAGGNPYVSAATPWTEAVCGKTRTKPTTPRFAEWAERYNRCLIRNGFLLTAPMMPNQVELITAMAAADPTNADLAARADVDEFNDAIGELWYRNIEISQYVGAPWRYERLGNETIPVWSHRLKQELAPQLAHCSTMIYDNTMGTNQVYGDWKCEAVRHFLGSHPCDVAGEPMWFAYDGDWCEKFGSFLSTDFLHVQETKNPNATTEFAARKPNGTFPGDPSPLIVPGITGSPVYLWLDFRSTPAFDGDPKKSPLDYIKTIHDRWPHAWLCAPFGLLPVELLN